MIRKIVVFILFFMPLLQATGQLPEKRLALVIGNADYLAGPLTNPVNDARSMARALRSAGFEVMLRENVSNQTEMKRIIREYGQKLRGTDVGLFYFAGHGVQVKGFNFLIPVNAVINSEEDVEYEGVDAGFVLAQMEAAQNRVNIVILDACRNNPFARTFRSTRQGLVSMNAPAGSIIAYATSPGKTAMDGTGVNGLYTQELLYQLQRPGLKIEDVFKNVRIEVMRKSDDQQIPWESSSLTGDFYFVPDQQSVSVEEKATPSDVVMWKASTDKLILSRNNREITAPRTYPFGNDLIAEDPSSRERYLLRNYWNNRDNQWRQAEILPAARSDYYSNNEPQHTIPTREGNSGKAQWKADNKGNFWFFVNGRDVSQEITVRREKSALLVKDPKTGHTYRIEEVAKKLDNTLRDVDPQQESEVHTPSEKGLTPFDPATTKVVWRAESDGTYYIRVNGNEISQETTYSLQGNDLYVFHTPTGTTFILKNFVNRLDNRWRKGAVAKE